MKTPTCTGCGGVKPTSEFVRLAVTDKMKQFHMCNDCNNSSTECKSAKKRQLETEEIDNQENDQVNLDGFDIIEPNDLCSHFAQILDDHSAQPENLFQFQCDINISTFDKSPKEIAKELVELIEDVDEFAWIQSF
ncbi:hypothetical protein F8M41_002671 [Gigaspora margarita]|uniref:Uncharacterized protein n=1 Tax=Gigaspora margarita TaxID=4874 RepID=A0A8H4A757_GIGMA|nr:hypothetical protein F8M41_002671 [Gigaspora margarita]